MFDCVEEANASKVTWVARASYYYSGQHMYNWTIQFNAFYKMNYSDPQWNQIAAHEIAHLFGLDDLYESRNSHRQMWQYAGSYSGLTQEEKDGLKIR